jgi:hypothetical protein
MRSKSEKIRSERLELDELLESVESKKHKLKPIPEYTFEYDADASPGERSSVKNSDELKKINDLITDFSRLMERAHFKEFIEVQERPWRWHFINFFTSILKGIGFIFGAALAISSILFIWSQLNWVGLITLLRVLKKVI